MLPGPAPTLSRNSFMLLMPDRGKPFCSVSRMKATASVRWRTRCPASSVWSPSVRIFVSFLKSARPLAAIFCTKNSSPPSTTTPFASKLVP
eukprot:9477626-Pyramimonas_sp.AAC.1